MQAWGQAREVEQVKTITARRLKAHTDVIQVVGRLKQQEEAIGRLFGDNCPLLSDVRNAVAMLVTLCELLPGQPKEEG